MKHWVCPVLALIAALLAAPQGKITGGAYAYSSEPGCNLGCKDSVGVKLSISPPTTTSRGTVTVAIVDRDTQDLLRQAQTWPVPIGSSVLLTWAGGSLSLSPDHQACPAVPTAADSDDDLDGIDDMEE
jgi:hypothetical protein